MSLPWKYRVEAIGLKTFQLYLENYDFCENLKFYILSITAYLKFESKNPFELMWHI